MLKRIEKLKATIVGSKTNGTVERCGYEDTESYQVMEMFMNNRKVLIDRLLEK